MIAAKSKTSTYMRYDGQEVMGLDKEGAICHKAIMNPNVILQHVCVGMIKHLPYMHPGAIFGNIKMAVEMFIDFNFLSLCKIVPKTHTGTLKYLDSWREKVLGPVEMMRVRDGEGISEEGLTIFHSALVAYCYDKQLESEGLGTRLSAV
jgi:hypothetical protein